MGFVDMEASYGVRVADDRRRLTAYDEECRKGTAAFRHLLCVGSMYAENWRLHMGMTASLSCAFPTCWWPIKYQVG